jgi:segregation and condensation protein B
MMLSLCKIMEQKKQVEAILFSAGRKIEIEEISRLCSSTDTAIVDALKSLQKEYDERDAPIMIIEEGTAWKMAVRENYLNLVRRITPYMEFSKSLMETLAVVAWKQPIIQSDVIKVRTNKAYDHIDELEKMGFLAREKHGRSFLLKLSQKFYDYFDLRSDVDVKNLFKHIKEEGPTQKKVDEFEPESLKVEDEATGQVDEGQKNDVTIEADVPEVREQDALPAKKAAKK